VPSRAASAAHAATGSALAPQEPPAAFRIRELTKVNATVPGAVRALDGVDLDIARGELLPVTAVAQDYSGPYVYIARGALNHLLGDGDLASSADLLAATDQPQALDPALAAQPQIVAASSRDDTVTNWHATTAKSFTVTIVCYLGFGIAIAFGVAYNMGRITLAKRARDLAMLQVFGFTTADCAYVPLGALARTDGRWAVHRIEEGRARLRTVEVGALTDREAEIRAGVADGERIVVFPSDAVIDGVRVQGRQ